MKKTISVMLMSLIGMVGTYAWGTARGDSVDRLQSSVEVCRLLWELQTKASLKKC